MKNEILSFLHTVLIIIAWASPFWLDWKIILIVFALYELQMFLFKGCILVNLQFEGKTTKRSDMTMYAYWAEKMGYKVNREKLKFSSSYIMPVVIMLLSLFWQIILNMLVWIKI